MTGTAARAPQAPLENLRHMLTIRRTEEKVIHFSSDPALLPGHYHVYIGQEASGVATCNALDPGDYIFTTHRNHGHVIARGGEPGAVLAEILGRSDGYNGGRGGTFHVAAPELGILQTSAIVGGCLPLAAGAALSIKQRKTNQISLVFFGDGAVEEGAFFETANMAALWKLPVIFLCENNDVPPALRTGGEMASTTLAARRLSDIPQALTMPTVTVDGADIEAMSSVMADVVASVRGGAGPIFVEARITHWPGNDDAFPVLPGGPWQLDWAFSPDKGPERLREWLRDSDPLALYSRALVDKGITSIAGIADMDAEVCRKIDAAADFAVQSPPRPAEAALEHVFA
jgi:pyruvate dehydrogenase E1 component alpha subunit